MCISKGFSHVHQNQNLNGLWTRDEETAVKTKTEINESLESWTEFVIKSDFDKQIALVQSEKDCDYSSPQSS